MGEQAPEFVEWLARGDDELEVFLREDVSGMPEDPYSEAGLRRVEEIVLEIRAAKDWTWIERQHRFHRFVGEVFVRCFEGRWDWVEVTEWGETRMRPVVLLDFTISHDPEALINRAWVKRSGDLIPRLFRFDTAWYAHWVETGRPAGEAWERESDRAQSGILDVFSAREAQLG